MNFAEALEALGYVRRADSAVFMRPDYGGIAYSDGDAVEERIAAVIREAGDITCFSSELAMRCTDWPSRYHLSANRGNILRPFRDRLKGAEVLEIGAGCGAITRFLGESGARVLALEGSPRRAAIARSRTRDLVGVTVLAERFDRFQWQGHFDVVTLIGVLEYAPLFTEGEEPALAMLARARELLRPGGRLMLAIENKYGLKYFAGAPEDHFGRPMYGIEGRYEAKGPRTWGRKTLRAMLERAGFNSQNWLAPFPDYKVPVSIVTEAGLNCPDFDSAAFAWQSARRDPQLPQYLHFAPELAWPGLVEDGLGLDLANSFLVCAGTEAGEADTTTLAYHYSVNDRRAAFCKETVFRKRPDGSIGLAYHPLGPDAAHEAAGELARWRIPREGAYIRGETLAARFVRIVSRDGWTLEEVGGFFREYLATIRAWADSRHEAVRLDALTAPLPGAYYDLIPQNIMRDAAGKRQVFDQEWSAKNDIPLGLLLFRALLQLASGAGRFGVPASPCGGDKQGLFLALFQAAGLAVTERELAAYGEMEGRLMADIIGGACDASRATARIWQPHEPLRVQSPPSRADGQEPSDAASTRIRLLRQQLAAERALAQGRLVAAHEPWRNMGAVSWRERPSAPQAASHADAIKAKLCALVDRPEQRRQLQACARLLETVPLFDREDYLRGDAALRRSRLDPLRHYFLHGAAEGRNPGPYFFTSWYLAEYPDVAASGMNPLLHFLQYGLAEGRKPNPYFFTTWYLRTYMAQQHAMHPLSHYLRQGHKAGARPNPYFDPAWYAATYFPPNQQDTEPLADFMGRPPEANRNPNPWFDSAWYRRAYPWVGTMGIHPLQHFIQFGTQEHTEPNPYFDSRWYAEQHPEAQADGLPPFAHYLAHVGEDTINPNPFFDAAWYRRAYVDVREADIDPFLHYLLHGAAEFRDPGPHFNTYWYAQTHPDVAAGGMNPLLHYLTIGRHEGRRPHPDFGGKA